MSLKPFIMKQFKVRHRLSAMKVGVDAVLLGAWCELPAGGRVLDAGCGCGIISLMLAQRKESIRITAIDLDPLAVIEARQNFAESPWPGRLHGCRRNFLALKERYDAIISNPPYFDAGLKTVESRREMARHASGFSPLSLLTKGAEILNPGGTISLICPPDWLPHLIGAAGKAGLRLRRRCGVLPAPGSPAVRVMLTFSDSTNSEPVEETIAIEYTRGHYTPEYIRLTQNFYLNF